VKIGIIAEDDSDVLVMRELTLSLLRTHRVGFRSFVGDGCGKLRRKCRAWAHNLVRQGCNWLVVVHDLDTYDERQLRNELTSAITPARAKASVVLIPKREIEAWLLYDPAAIAAAFNETQRPKLPGDPESLMDPKNYLDELIRKKYRKDYFNTIHNRLIAKHINISLLRRSSSFAPHPTFVNTVRSRLH
jgi:Domain of unknown function (DUF4276)